MNWVFSALLAVLVAGCGVKTDLVPYETWQADQAKAANEKAAAEKAKAEAAAKAAQPAPEPPPPPVKKKRKQS